MTKNIDLSLITVKIASKKWALTENYVFTDYLGNKHTILAGFITDFQSTPWWGEWIAPHRGVADYAALEHDYLYYSQKITRQQSDMHFCKRLIEAELSPFRATFRYYTLRAMGWKAWAHNQKPNQHRILTKDQLNSFILKG